MNIYQETAEALDWTADRYTYGPKITGYFLIFRDRIRDGVEASAEKLAPAPAAKVSGLASLFVRVSA